MNLTTKTVEVLTLIYDSSTANPGLRKRIEDEFQSRIAKNYRFTREYFYSVSQIGKRTMTVSFYPTTKAYERYGASVMIDLLLSEEMRQELSGNYVEKKRSWGNIKAIPKVASTLTIEQVELLAKEGFDTTEVCEVVF